MISESLAHQSATGMLPRRIIVPPEPENWGSPHSNVPPEPLQATFVCGPFGRGNCPRMKNVIFFAIFTLMRLIVKNLRAAAVILLAALAAGSCSRKAEIGVMSYNIRLGVANDSTNSWEIRKPATKTMLDNLKPEVFGVQEAYDFQVDYILQQCPRYKAVGVGREDGVREGEHMSVFFDTKRIELLDWGTYWLSETPDVPSFGWDAACKRTATWTLLKERRSGRRFWFVNTHLDHVGVVARREGLALISRNISAMNPEGLPMILTGDFNVTPDNPGLEGIRAQMSYARETAGRTDDTGSYNGWGKASEVIDYIWYSGFSGCPYFRTVTESFAGIPFVSDHYPVVARLTF